MPKHDALFDAKLPECLLIERRVSPRRPYPARPRAIAISRPLDDDHAVVLREPIHQIVYCEVLNKGAIAMDEHQGLTLPALDIMKAHPIHAQEATYRWVFPLGVTGLLDRIESRRAQRGGEPEA